VKTYQAQRLCPPPISAQQVSHHVLYTIQCDRGNAYLAAAFAWVDGILAIHRRLGRGRLHGWVYVMCSSGAPPSSDNASRRASDGHPDRAVARVSLMSLRGGEVALKRVGSRAAPREVLLCYVGGVGGRIGRRLD
jgi:hypothetical protein